MNRKYLCKPTPVRLTDPIFYSCCFEHAAHLPPAFDRRGEQSPVRDQQTVGCCTGEALNGYAEWKQLQSLSDRSKFVPTSPEYIYARERIIEGTLGQDAGAMIGDGLAVLRQYGVCPESDYPFSTIDFNYVPSARADAAAAAHKIGLFHRIPTVPLLKAAIFETGPCPIGVAVYESFESDSTINTGFIVKPDPRREQLLGGHALLVVGYDDNLKHGKSKGFFVIKNSWGASCGDKGYFFAPYSYFTAALVSDRWAVM